MSSTPSTPPASSESRDATSDPKAYRLPGTAAPRHYDITLDARPGRETFSGAVSARIDVLAPTRVIELHARGLEITRAAFSDASGQTYTTTVTLDPEREIASITLDRQAAAGEATLALDYTGRLSVSLEGLFVSKDGPDEMLCSQCEATGARAIIPCWDEPIFKATFAWTVVTAPGEVVLTNGRPLGTETSADGASVTWRFAPTKRMSSYLLAVTIGAFASAEERVVNGIPLRIWALKGKEALGGFALDITAGLLTFYEEYFAAPYHFDKLDNVGVPNFGAGAMENAGLIVSQAVLLLLDERASSRQQELNVAEVTAHEFAHMWFGDLVTMRWWDDLWLNEAFATWMSYHAINRLRPEYRVWDETQAGTNAALALDSLASSHPIYNPVSTPNSVLENFDPITYQKGCAVLRMVHDYLGDEAFRAGLRAYMAEFAESNATGADLWRHLQQASDQPVTAMMESWILQAGHPLVNVRLDGVSNGEARVSLRQQRYFSAANAPASEQLWITPVLARYEDGAGVHTTRYLLSEREGAFTVPVSGELRWLYANADQVGYYRQRLDEVLLTKVRANLDRLSVAERKGLLGDQWALVANGAQTITPYLDTLAALARSGDDETLLGQIVGEHLGRIENQIETAGDEQALAQYRAWVGDLFRERMAALGYEPQAGEAVETARLRAVTLNALARFARDPEAIAQARAFQEREERDPTSVDANLAPVAINAAARAGDAVDYDRFLALYQARKGGAFTPDQVERYAGTFALFEPADLTRRTLGLMEDEETFPFQEQIGLLVSLLTRRRTQRAGWDYITAHWGAIQQRAPFMTSRFVEFTGVLPASMRAEVVAFWDAQLNGEYGGAYARALEVMDQREELRMRVERDLLAYFTR
ncbi:MAG TPA: M1 family metallopeptidase [Ktedonobacterales bacterium]